MYPVFKNVVVKKDLSSSDVKPINFGFVSEVRYQTTNNVFFSFRYTRGMTNYRTPEIYKNDYLGSFNFSVGYLIKPNWLYLKK